MPVVFSESQVLRANISKQTLKAALKEVENAFNDWETMPCPRRWRPRAKCDYARAWLTLNQRTRDTGGGRGAADRAT